MFLVLLLAAWIWDPVLTDCSGAPETVTHYYLRATARQAITDLCLNEQGQVVTCQITVPSPPLRFGPDFTDTSSGSFDPVADPNLLPDPPLGGVTAWPWPTADNPDPVVAVDAAGNESGCS
jgi:hypothetical protein